MQGPKNRKHGAGHVLRTLSGLNTTATEYAKRRTETESKRRRTERQSEARDFIPNTDVPQLNHIPIPVGTYLREGAGPLFSLAHSLSFSLSSFYISMGTHTTRLHPGVIIIFT